MTRITERIAGEVPGWGARLSYGEARTVAGAELVPVAFVAFGFGAGDLGAGHDAPKAGDAGEVASSTGEGGGSGGVSIPLGAYIAGPDGLRFRPNPVVLLALGIGVIGAFGVALGVVVAATRSRR